MVVVVARVKVVAMTVKNVNGDNKSHSYSQGHRDTDMTGNKNGHSKDNTSSNNVIVRAGEGV